MTVSQRPFTGAALLTAAGLSFAILAAPSMGAAQDQVLTGPDLKPSPSAVGLAAVNSDSASQATEILSVPPCKRDCISRSEAYSSLKVYDSRQADNTTYQEQLQPRNKYDYHNVNPTRPDTPSDERFRWQYRAYDLKETDKYRILGPYDTEKLSIDSIRNHCVDVVASLDQENKTSEMIPLAKLKEWGYMVASCVDKTLSEKKEAENVDAYLCMRDGDGDPSIADHCFGWRPEKVIHHARGRSVAQNSTPSGDQNGP